jgi:hypothetical protein
MVCSNLSTAPHRSNEPRRLCPHQWGESSSRGGMVQVEASLKYKPVAGQEIQERADGNRREVGKRVVH